MKKNALLLGICILLTLTSCAGIKPNYRYQKTHKTPTQQINSFKDETQKRSLQSVIDTEKAPAPARSFFLQTKEHKKIKMWEKYFTTNGKRTFEIFLKNGQKYKNTITKIFKKHNLPEDLFYVGLIESGYKNHARSHAGAVGPWQFIKGTAKRYGLKVNRYVDERKNIYKSTEAAALYFQDLYNIFGSWELALSAYNAGEYGVIRRIRGANTRDFYELSKRKILPKETRNYVPKIIAAMNIDARRKQHNIKVPHVDSRFYDNVKSFQISHRTSIHNLAKKLKTTTSAIKSLNHDLRTNTIPYVSRKGFELYLPTNVSAASNTIKINPSAQTREVRKVASQKILNPKIHRVRKNESLISIAKRYNTSVSRIKSLNNIKGSMIYVGQKLKLDQRDKSVVYYSYVVKKGDHLSRLSKLFNTRIQTLKKMNQMRRSALLIGQKLKVPAHTKALHTVKKGEALYSIARKYKKSISHLKDLNNMNRSRIYPGQKLVVDIKTI